MNQPRMSKPDQQPVPEPQAVHVPAYAPTMAPPAPERIRLLRRYLVELMRGARVLRDSRKAQAPTRPEPAGFTGEVARTACALCQGWCCSKGGDHAYLDEPSMARIRRARPELDAWGILRLYTSAVADPACAGSCIFHGAQGCTLERGLRSDLCNRFFCTGLQTLVKQTAAPPSGVVIVAEKDGLRRASPVLECRGSG